MDDITTGDGDESHTSTTVTGGDNEGSSGSYPIEESSTPDIGDLSLSQQTEGHRDSVKRDEDGTSQGHHKGIQEGTLASSYTQRISYLGSKSATEIGESESFANQEATTRSQFPFEEKKRIIVEALKVEYKRQYDSIRPIPYVAKKSYCVNSIFVDGGVRVMVSNQSSGTRCRSWERLTSYNAMYHDPRMKSKRRILQGEPGYGKSTLTLQLVYDWCNGVPDSPHHDTEILILLRMRQFANVTSIYRAIKLYLLRGETRITQSDIRKVLHGCSSVSFLLDGYDEYPQRDNDWESDVRLIIMSKMFEAFDVTLTTRYLPEEYDKLTTKRLKLIGFDETARDSYIRKAITDDEMDIEKIKRGLMENPILDALCQVPLFFVMFAHMTHENKRFHKFNSVTEFFKYMVLCFHQHTRNKTTDYNAQRYQPHFEATHDKLDQIALDGLRATNQHITWKKEYIRREVGIEFYDHYISVGILVEEELFDDAGDHKISEEDIGSIIEVRFYHKLLCEWYAAFRLTEIAMKQSPDKLKAILDKLDPFDVQYVYRFACGLNAAAGDKIINYLKNRKDCDKFAILCILEQNEGEGDIEETISALCSRRLQIHENESKLLQRSTIQLLEIASSHGIAVSNLYLNWSLREINGGNIILKSGLCLPALSTLDKISVSADKLDENEVAELLRYGHQSNSFKEIWFLNCQLPEWFSSETLPNDSKEKGIKVVWPSYGCLLDLQSGKWQKAEDRETITHMCADVVVISTNSTESLQQSAIDLLEKASNQEIPISRVYLHKALSSVNDAGVVLHSGLSLQILRTVESIGIETEKGREISEQEFVDILQYGEQSQRIKKLRFFFCTLPFGIQNGQALAMAKTKNLTVMWLPYGWQERGYTFNVQAGLWQIKDSDQALSKLAYNEEVQAFRERFKHESTHE